MRKLSENEINKLLGDYKSALYEKCIDLYIHKDYEPITENVYIVSPWDAEYDNLIENNARGMCITDNGYIYIRDDIETTVHLLIHEFVHRLSRNFIDNEWILGIHNEEILYDFNDAITEMIAIDITGIHDENPYKPGVDILKLLSDKLGKHAFISAYFDGDIDFFKRHLEENYNLFVKTFSHLIYYWRKANITNDTEDEKQFNSALYSLVALTL